MVLDGYLKSFFQALPTKYVREFPYKSTLQNIIRDTIVE